MNKSPIWARIALAILTAAVLAFTLPAYGNVAINPMLAALEGNAASLGGVAGAFLGRQLCLALIALYAVVTGRGIAVMIGGFGLGFFNLHDAVMIFAAGGDSVGAVLGLVFAAVGFAAAYGGMKADRAANA